MTSSSSIPSWRQRQRQRFTSALRRCTRRQVRWLSLPLLEFGCLRFSVPQTETLACSLGRPGGNNSEVSLPSDQNSGRSFLRYLSLAVRLFQLLEMCRHFHLKVDFTAVLWAEEELMRGSRSGAEDNDLRPCVRCKHSSHTPLRPHTHLTNHF